MDDNTYDTAIFVCAVVSVSLFAGLLLGDYLRDYIKRHYPDDYDRLDDDE